MTEAQQAIERIILLAANGGKQITSPMRLWGEADTIRSEFHFDTRAGAIEYQLVKIKPQYRAAVYAEVEQEFLL